MNKINPQLNTTGLIPGRGEHDFYAGGNSPIQRKILMSDLNWRVINIPHEIQFINSGHTNGYDTLECVFYNGITDGLEYIMMQQIYLRMIPQWKIDWLEVNGYFKNGVLNFSERFAAINGGITSHGASIWEGATGARNCGMIPNDNFPPADNFNDNINPAFVTEAMKTKGKSFSQLFHINFEWVNDEDTMEFMKYSPLICVGYYGNQEGNEPIDPPHTGIQHCMLQVRDTFAFREIDDSYWKQFKTYKRSALHDFMALYVDASDNSMFNAQDFINKHDTFQVRNSGTGAYGVIYHNTPLLITQERAGLYLIDRDARGLLGQGAKLTVTLSQEEFDKIDWSKKF